ncbi:MAG: histidinol-phosphate transaminase [Candidatus Eisenbacteria bacterium]|nr:histidinol-phosphate transaminase [Candidatus Eisenbacteria bacterium]
MAVDIWKAARPEIKELVPYSPGKPIEEVERELGISGAMKFASNENPSGPSKAVLKAITDAFNQLNRYPDGGSYYVRHAIAKKFGLDPEGIVVANGSNEIIDAVGRSFISTGEEGIIANPSFIMYRIAVQVMGGKPIFIPTKGFDHDLEAMAAAVTPKTKVIFVCNPNNPTGTTLGKDEVESFMRAIPDRIVVVFDEAYIDLVDRLDYPDHLKYLREGRLVVVTRTFSKVHALAGLRIGYGITSPEIASLLNRVRLPFNVSCLAQAAALKSLEDDKHIKKSIEMSKEGRNFLSKKFAEMNLRVIPSETNFVLVDLGVDGVAVTRELEKLGLIVRSMVSFGMSKEFVRITTGTMSENRKLVEGMKKVLSGMASRRAG